MSCRQVAIVGVIATALAGAPTTSAADPIIIDLGIVSGTFHINASGSAGLRVSGQDFSLRVFDGGRVECNYPGCRVGLETLSSFSGVMGATGGSVMYGDRTFDLPQTGGGVFTFSSPNFALTPGVLTRTLPFGLSGRISILSGEGETFEQFEFRVSGSGTATGTYEQYVAGEETFLILRDLFVDFGPPPPQPTPVPEPASLVLLGTGLAGLIVRTARRRRQ